MTIFLVLAPPRLHYIPTDVHCRVETGHLMEVTDSVVAAGIPLLVDKQLYWLMASLVVH